MTTLNDTRGSSLLNSLEMAKTLNKSPLQTPADRILSNRYLPCIDENLLHLPPVMTKAKRWCCFRLEWDATRHKYNKIPKRSSNVEWGASTAQPEHWGSLEQALAACQSNRDTVHGVGYLMTTPHGVVGVDLDKCSDAFGRPNTFAERILRNFIKAGAYAERSVGGHGYRIFFCGDVPDRDWTNHKVGIEVYGGHSPRFLTVTGNLVDGSYL